MSKVWLITGTSTGFGRQFVEQLIQSGDKVVATARNIESIADFKQLSPENVHIAALDVTNTEQIKAAVHEAVNVFGKIDIVVNNAGYGLFGMFEEYTDEQIRRQFDVNVFGVLNVIRETLPVLKKQGSGHYVNISSFFGTWSVPPYSIYASSKFALEGFSEAFAAEFAAFGIKTTIVEPSIYGTDFFGHGMDRTQQHPDYAALYEGYEKNLSTLTIGNPVNAVKAIIEMVNGGNHPLHFPVGSLATYSIREAAAKRIAEIDAWEKISSQAD